MATPSEAWPNRKMTATVVDTESPPGAWSGWPKTEPSAGAWPTRKKPQRAPRRLSQPTRPTTTAPAQSRPVGRWIVTAALWALALGLFAGRTIAAHVDQGVEAGMDWLAVRAPSFVRPYLPERVPKLTEPRGHRQSVASPPAAEVPPSKEAALVAPKHERSRRHR